MVTTRYVLGRIDTRLALHTRRPGDRLVRVSAFLTRSKEMRYVYARKRSAKPGVLYRIIIKLKPGVVL